MSNIVFKVKSDSMSPLIQIGDILEFNTSYDELSTFDIILYKRNDSLFVHFIWRNQILYNKSLITRSLKNKFIDEEPVLIEDFVGKVTNFKINKMTRFYIMLLNLLRGTF